MRSIYLTTSSHLRKIAGKDGTKIGPELYNQVSGRASSALIAQLRTGHCGFNYYLSRLKKVESGACEKCGYERKTVEHYLLGPSF
jgi:hypothetical protein